MLSEIATFLLTVAFGLLGFFFIARFLLQVVRADFYNPISQSIVRLTDPVLQPMRQLLKPRGNIDFAALVAVLVVELLHIVTVFTFAGAALPGVPALALLTVVQSIDLMLGIYFYALLVSIIASWIAPAGGHPALSLIHQLTEPVLAPIRRLLPPAGGLDFSTMVALLIIYILRDIVLPRLG